LRFGDKPVVFLTAAEAANLLRVSVVTPGAGGASKAEALHFGNSDAE